MKITKFPQSCLLIETNGKKILVDPGVLKYKDDYFDIWNSVDVILVTHKHGDHINAAVLEKLNQHITIYSTNEVKSVYPTLDIRVVKENDVISIDNINIEVVHAIHGYQPMLKDGKEIFENVGYIIDDNINRLYITSDTICFKNNYKADILCIPVTGYGLTMSAFEASLYAKEVDAKHVILTHMDNNIYPSDFEYVKDTFYTNNVEYKILEIEETIEI